MTTSRLQLAFPDGHPGGDVLVIGARAADDLDPLTAGRTRIEQPMFTDHQALTARGFDAAPSVDGVFQTVIVKLPRAKPAARARIAAAAAKLDGLAAAVGFAQAHSTTPTAISCSAVPKTMAESTVITIP